MLMKTLSLIPPGVRRLAVAAACTALAGAVTAIAAAEAPVLPAVPEAGPGRVLTIRASVPIATGGRWRKRIYLEEGKPFAISAAIEKPELLPPNGRLLVSFGPEEAWPGEIRATGRKVNDFDIPAPPSAGWSKLLHALDTDLWLAYRAPASGWYWIELAPVEKGPWPGSTPRWREKGAAAEIFPIPEVTPWPAGARAQVALEISPLPHFTQDEQQQARTFIETEPNDTPEQALPIRLEPLEEVTTYEVTGSADDVEYFDNGLTGRAGDDWYRVTIGGDRPMLVTAQLGIPGQFIVAQIRTYRQKSGIQAPPDPAELLPIEEWSGEVNRQRLPYTEGKQVETPEGRDPNERAHQQEEQHRTSISRLMKPGEIYFLRVEANAPGYQLQLRILPPAPYTDPRLAVRQAMYNHIGQVDSWLANRPRGAGVERRIRDTGNLLGTQCMSCHTQSGIWGPAVPLQNGYPLESPQNAWRLLNIMYECLRPTNVLKDAANNTSLAPLDIGDGPAGTRAAGFNIVNAEQVFPPRRLHSMQQRRTANYVLQTADPGGINAAGPGSNIGRNIVWLFAAEILKRAWHDSGDPRYFRKLEEKARLVLEHEARFTDDLGVRLDFFGRLFPPAQHAAESARASAREQALGLKPEGGALNPEEFGRRVRQKLREDEERLRGIQHEDGAWGFNPGTREGETWKPATQADWDPSPTALAITGLAAAGHGDDDPAIARGVRALLAMQDANGRWNRASITGFVPTAYVLRALGGLYPMTPRTYRRHDFLPRQGETFPQTVARIREMALHAEPDMVDLLTAAARHQAAPVRWWALIGLGKIHRPSVVPVLMEAASHPARPLRDAAGWALKQTILDNTGWGETLQALAHGGSRARESAAQVLGLRADAVMPRAGVNWDQLGRILSRAMNEDPHPAVRAWAARAAWQIWIWNPPVRPRLEEAWLRLLTRNESSVLVENANRYSAQALFIANGHKANGSEEHQYKELADLFEALDARYDKANPGERRLIDRRMTAIAATFFQQSGGDGGPGQMGYKTPGAGGVFGRAVQAYLQSAVAAGDTARTRQGLQGAANIPHTPLQEFLIDFALKAPEDLRREVAAAVSDPRSARLQAATELVEPLIAQVRRGAIEPDRREALSDPVLQLFASVTWVIPANEEQQRHFFDLIIPDLSEYGAGASDGSTEADRNLAAGWYLSDGLGKVLGGNPDLHLPLVVTRYFPEKLGNPVQRHFWVRSVPWILALKPAASAPGAGADTAPDQLQLVKERALQLFLESLKPDAPAATRAAAVRLANTTSVRSNPEVLVALEELQKHETDPELKKIAANVVKQGQEKFLPDLIAALRAEKRPGEWVSAAGSVNPVFLADFIEFRDYVLPELARVKRADQQACLGCHAVAGRVPSLQLAPVDEYGYQSVGDMLRNYRELQARIDYADIDRSKLLRKPLNVQDGQEDGHQGGRRYLPTDEGYLLLKKWAANQPRVHQAVGAAPPSAPAAPAPAAPDQARAESLSPRVAEVSRDRKRPRALRMR